MTLKILYIEGRSKTKPEEYFIDPNFIKNLPKQIVLVYSIQFKGQAEVMKKAMEANNIRIMGFQQVLGCSKLKTEFPIVLIGQGSFHALNLAKQNKGPVIIYSNGSSLVMDKILLEKLQKKKQAAISRFFASDNIGVIVSTKPGQENLKAADKFIEKMGEKYPSKKFYLFFSNNINVREFENFKIESWINSACPGLSDDNPKIANIDDILELI